MQSPGTVPFFEGLFYVEHGAGTPVLAMHGGLGWDHTYLRPWLDDLGHVVYYDHRGNGRSEEPSDWARVTHVTWIDDAEALRSHLFGAPPVVLFGHSYGALLALEYALRFPSRLSGLILCCGTPVFDKAEAAVARACARAEEAPDPDATRAALQNALSAPPADDDAYAAVLRDLLPIYVYEPEAFDPRAMVNAMRPRAKAVRRSFFELLPEFDVSGRLGEIKVPTLVLSGRHDWAFPPEEGPARLNAALPNANTHVFELSGHLPFMEEPEAFSQVVSGWLSNEVNQ